MLRENSAMNIVLLTKFHYSKFIMASTIPFDLFVSFAEFGGDSLAYHLAQTCRGVKWRLDQRYEIKRMMKLSKILSSNNERNPAVFGKFISVDVDTLRKTIPSSVKILYFPFFQFTPLVIPTSIEQLDIILSSYESIVDVNSLVALRKLTIFGEYHSTIQNLEWPPNLEVIELDGGIETTLTGVIFPKSLRVFSTIRASWVYFDHQTFPETLETLKVKGSLDQRITELPAGLKHLNIGFCDVGQLRLPQHLLSLKIDHCISEPEILHGLPDSLEHLECPSRLLNFKLPLNLKYCSGSYVGIIHDRLIAMGMTKITDTCYEKMPQ